MRASTKRILSIGIAAIFFLSAAVVYFSFVQPEITVINAKRAKVFAKSNLFNNQQTAVLDVQKLIAKLQNVAKVEEAISFAMPVGINAVNALRQVESIARMSSVSLSSLGFKAPPIRTAALQPFMKKMGTLEISASALGSYENLKKFLQLVETTVRISNVQEFRFQPATTRGGLDTLNVTVAMYYQE